MANCFGSSGRRCTSCLLAECWIVLKPFHVGALTDSRLDHIVLDQAKHLNPLYGSNYSDEDMMGNIKVLAASSSPLRLGFQVMERYSAYVCCRWMQRGG